MIPRRIKLSGFLCYRDEQEVAFDGASLWMLSGLNGSGKSSIFDAVTYALFGHHRGGSQGAAELINKNENGFAIEFDFALEGKEYRIKRTLKRRSTSTAATQQVLAWRSDAGAWEPIADTQRKTEFDIWIREHVGLTFETFTSSVLLLQGRAEKLLDSTAKGRAELLAGIVDLERYQKLQEKADTQRKSLKGKAEVIQNQLDAIEDVTELELFAALHRIEESEQEVNKAQLDVERLQALEFQSRLWVGAKRKLADAQKRRGESSRLIQQAEEIEKKLARLQELREVLPHVEVIVHRRADLARSEDRTKALAQETRNLGSRISGFEHQLDGARRRHTIFQGRIQADETRLAELNKRLPELSALQERLRAIDRSTEELRELEADLGKFPADVPRQLTEAQRRVDELADIERAVSPLQRLAESRRELRLAREQIATSQQQETTIKSRGEELRRQHDSLRPQNEESLQEVRRAGDLVASERALLQQAEQQRATLDEVAGDPTCRVCGSPLTEQHLIAERAARDAAIVAGRKRVAAAEQRLTECEQSVREQQKELAQLELALQTARDEYRDARTVTQQAQLQTKRLEQECQRTYAELPEAFCQRIAPTIPADWVATSFPTDEQLEDLRRQLSDAPEANRRLKHLSDCQLRVNNLHVRIKSVNQSINEQRATIKGDPDAIRQEYSRVHAEVQSLIQQVQAARKEEQLASEEAERINTDLVAARESLLERTGQAQTEDATQKLCHQAITSSRKALSPDWQARIDVIALAELHRLRSEREEFERDGIEEKARQLQAARVEAESLRQTIESLNHEIGQYPPEAHQEPSEIQRLLSNAKSIVQERTEQHRGAKNHRDNLEQRVRMRKDLRGNLTEVERELKRYRLLAELLGRDRLQRHLVRQAERQIVDYSNSVLDRLSGGTLMLRLVGAEDGAPADHALELEAYNRATGQAPINVAFLSGSQRFRVAVSLALGIGQYASRLHRPIESVIIDEGFGCLDRQGRQVMIQELQNLRGHLQCILLVSHQEEFADAFADGYRFELADGATRVTRLQR